MAKSEDCKKIEDLKVGLIENDYIDYSYYLYYSLGEYSNKNNINFEIKTTDHNFDDFDVIFGEYDDLIKLSQGKIDLPKSISSFYINNSIKLKNDIFPLDLDTFILLSKQDKEISNLEELIKYKSHFKYNFAMSYLSKKKIKNFFLYNLNTEYIDITNQTTESTVTNLERLFKNQNKNIILANHNELYDSYNLEENIFTLFSDGILLSKNIIHSSFQLFPISKYQWSKNKGKFVQEEKLIPKSFFGFSAFLNNINASDLICFMISDEIRIKGFESFNIQLSPLSEFEVNKLNLDIDDMYYHILKNKNKNIIDYSIGENDLNQLINIVYGETEYKELDFSSNYFN